MPSLLQGITPGYDVDDIMLIGHNEETAAITLDLLIKHLCPGSGEYSDKNSGAFHLSEMSGGPVV